MSFFDDAKIVLFFGIKNIYTTFFEIFFSEGHTI